MGLTDLLHSVTKGAQRVAPALGVMGATDKRQLRDSMNYMDQKQAQFDQIDKLEALDTALKTGEISTVEELDQALIDSGMTKEALNLLPQVMASKQKERTRLGNYNVLGSLYGKPDLAEQYPDADPALVGKVLGSQASAQAEADRLKAVQAQREIELQRKWGHQAGVADLANKRAIELARLKQSLKPAPVARPPKPPYDPDRAMKARAANLGLSWEGVKATAQKMAAPGTDPVAIGRAVEDFFKVATPGGDFSAELASVMANGGITVQMPSSAAPPRQLGSVAPTPAATAPSSPAQGQPPAAVTLAPAQLPPIEVAVTEVDAENRVGADFPEINPTLTPDIPNVHPVSALGSAISDLNQRHTGATPNDVEVADPIAYAIKRIPVEIQTSKAKDLSVKLYKKGYDPKDIQRVVMEKYPDAELGRYVSLQR